MMDTLQVLAHTPQIVILHTSHVVLTTALKDTVKTALMMMPLLLLYLTEFEQSGVFNKDLVLVLRHAALRISLMYTIVMSVSTYQVSWGIGSSW